MFKHLIAATLAWTFSCSASSAVVTIEVSVPGGALRALDGRASGRMIVFLVDTKSTVGSRDPIEGPFWAEEQPIFAVSAKVKEGDVVVIDDRSDHTPWKLSDLPAGTYRAQALLRTQHSNSQWRRERGNVYSSKAVEFTVGGPDSPARVRIELDAQTGLREQKDEPGVEWFEVRSALLSDFRGCEVRLRAGVVAPREVEAGRRYAAVYHVPGFGGDHREAGPVAAERANAAPGSPEAEFASNAFEIVLDPEGPNGHTLFADSANNGPCGRALVEELIPALEAKFPLARRSEARLLRGHSSGGWSTLWLALTYPETFGATWSTSPDPVDFRRFQLTDIYADANFYAAPADGPTAERLGGAAQGLLADSGGERLICSFRREGQALMSVRREATGEDLLGPDNTSGQQWDSWFAAWGPRNAAGHPAALIDPATGAIDHAMAERYREYDIGEMLRRKPEKIGALLRGRVRLAVGDADNFFLNEAVMLLKADLERLAPAAGGEGGPGCIKILPGLDHGTIFGSPEIRAFPAEMLAHLRKHGLRQAP